MKGIINIISYFGRENKQIRKEAHNIQIKFWLKNKDYNINILAINYTKDDYINHKRITYIKQENIILPSEARNILLQQFYNSDYDFTIFCDNDAILIPEYSDINIENYFKIDKQIDVFCPVNPRQQPYKKLNTRQFTKVNLNNNYYFWNWPGSFYGSIFYMRNINKIYNKKVFFDKNFKNLEDRDFAYNLIKHGISVFICANCVFKDLSKNKSTLTEIDTLNKRVISNNIYKRKICQKYNLELTKHYKIQANKFKNINCKRNTTIIVRKNGN